MNLYRGILHDRRKFNNPFSIVTNKSSETLVLCVIFFFHPVMHNYCMQAFIMSRVILITTLRLLSEQLDRLVLKLWESGETERGGGEGVMNLIEVHCPHVFESASLTAWTDAASSSLVTFHQHPQVSWSSSSINANICVNWSLIQYPAYCMIIQLLSLRHVEKT